MDIGREAVLEDFGVLSTHEEDGEVGVAKDHWNKQPQLNSASEWNFW